ncbi:unnamed protein product [Spirodela intermedia]|uniref:Reverse transcriptase Ty1/copia-type domain-containing protein n=1 Tax=Spirodela intermedia TaxID=51605 RepID=A0A7I8LKT0_SPIIN|nr:unnamed protein product [Spirodela intermedia]
MTILLVYVDDMIVIRDDMQEIPSLKKQLTIVIKVLGQLKYFLGIEVAYSRGNLFLSQRKYITDLVKYTCMSNYKPACTLIEAKHCIGASKESDQVDKGSYQQLVGKLIYLSHTRPDIAYLVGVLSQYMHDLREVHHQAAQQVLAYLKGTIVGIYTDVDYVGSVDDRHSTTGYCYLIGGNLITWQSQKQRVVAQSSVEAEFRAMALRICDGIWIKNILNDLQIPMEGSITLFCDDQSTISIAHDLVQHNKSRHIEVGRHFIKEKLESGMFCTEYVSSTNQLADILTKGISVIEFCKQRSKLGMNDIHAPA